MTDAPTVTVTEAHRRDVNAFLRSRQKRDGDYLLIPVLTSLVKLHGGVRSKGAFHVRDGNRWVSVCLGASADAIAEQVHQTKGPLEKGGQDSRAIVNLLRAVAVDLYRIAEKEVRVLRSNTLSDSDGDSADVCGGDCQYETQNVKVTYSTRVVSAALEKLQPDYCYSPWFMKLCLASSYMRDELEFDVLDGSIRSGGHIVRVVRGEDGEPRGLSLEPVAEELMLLDAGHDLSGMEDLSEFMSGGGGGTGELAADLDEAQEMLSEWFPDDGKRQFVLHGLGERLLLAVRKRCYVLETPSDRGKTAFLYCLLAAMGSYARRLPNAGLDGSNKRTARVHELMFSKNGVRFICHDEADRIDWEYLKAESNGAIGNEYSVGMGQVIECEFKATRVITKNAARRECQVRSAPRDARAKIIHLTGETMKPPSANQERHQRILSGDKRLSRGVFLAILQAYHSHPSPYEWPVDMLCGDDLRPVAPAVPSATLAATESGPSATGSGVSAAAAFIAAARSEFSARFRLVGPSETGTEAAVVQKVVSEATGADWLAALPIDVFVSCILCAGHDTGDGIAVPPQARGYTMKDGKKQRLAHVMQCRPSHTA